MTALLIGCLAGSALVLVWPGGRRAHRRARLRIGPAAGAVAVPVESLLRRARALARWDRVSATVRSAPGAWMLAAGAAGAGWWAGPVAATMAAAYGGVGLWAVGRHRRTRVAARARRVVLDDLAAAAADLRAGLPGQLPGPATGGAAGPVAPVDPLLVRVAAVRELAEGTGAPLADLVERIEADARSLDRARATAAAQAAGSRATAWLLAGLPVGGVALGYAIGVDPLAVLFRTPVGALCAVGAVGLQLAGLAWTHRLAGRSEVVS